MGTLRFLSATTTHRDKAIDFNKRVCTLTLYPQVDKCVCILNHDYPPVMPWYCYLWFCSVTIEQSHKFLTARSHIPQYVTFRTKMRIFLFLMVHCVIWDMCIMGFMKTVCSSLGQDYLGVITLQTCTWPVMAMGGWSVAQQIWTESENIDFFSMGQWGKLFGSATFAGRNGRLTAPSDKICWGATFSVFNRLKPNLVCLLGDRVNDHPLTLTKIGQL